MKVADKQKCPNGHITGVRELVPSMEHVVEIAEKMDYGEPEVQCPVCCEWFCLQTVQS